MRYKERTMKDDIEEIGCCKMGYPEGYYKIGEKLKDPYKIEGLKQDKKKCEQIGPEGYWGI